MTEHLYPEHADSERRDLGHQDLEHWDFEHRPRRLRIAVIALAILTVLVHIVWAIVLVRDDTGVTIGIVDQLAFVVIGLIFAGVLLTLLRIRVRVGEQGVEVRGPLRTRLWDWQDIVGITFPRSSMWPRLELPAYEHVGVWAILTVDGQDAVEAMGTMREIIRRYKPSAADPETVADR
ncbi:MAG: PH domain-containing protein [Dietzia psychralcaliphila]